MNKRENARLRDRYDPRHLKLVYRVLVRQGEMEETALRGE